VAVQREGLYRILRFAGLLNEDPEARTPLPKFKSKAVMCERTGLWFREVPPGSEIEAGALLGVIQDPFGSVLEEARSPVPGVVIYGLASLAANSGDLVASIATPMDAAAPL
jgi:predicted deacylase